MTISLHFLEVHPWLVYSLFNLEGRSGRLRSRQEIALWLWDNVLSSLQGNPQDVCPSRHIFSGVQLYA